MATPESVSELLNELSSILTDKGIDVGQLRFLLSDRDIEVIFVAHVNEGGEFCPNGCEDTSCVDGLNGEAVLTKRLKKKGLLYHKTTTGIELFKKVNPAVVAHKSEAFSQFRS